MFRNSSAWIEEYKKRGALWIHDGKPQRPHALLTSGKHSSGFFKSKIVTDDEVLLLQASSDLLDLFSVNFHDLSDVDCIVGPATGATKLAEALSYEIAWRSPDILTCEWASPTKFEENGFEKMRFDDAETAVRRGEHLLLCEDVLTTGKSMRLCESAVNLRGATTLPAILTIVNRSGFESIDGKRIFSLITEHMPIWEPSQCPLCKQGSKPIRPKEGDNWTQLNAVY